ncbi:MAG: hypothetical protein KGM96_05900 [Acidobacteriota bacterium]|nr:hypothetical protein [Acidobacteriota bacterium]
MLACLPVAAQGGGLFSRHSRAKADADTPPPKKPFITASQQAALAIPVEPLGFYAPGAYYQGQRESLVSLDFIDENRLLFTFRAPGLIHRTGSAEEEERHIRAIVLALPQGAVEAETLWTLHDHERYLWMLRNGHFLLRDRDDLKQGDATLELKPLLHFPGPLLWLEMDPTQHYLVTDSSEPAETAPKPGEVPSPATATASVSTGNADSEGPLDIVVRILHRETGQVMLVSRVRNPVRLPINPDGYLEVLRSNDRNWMLNLNYFTGGSRILGKLDSACTPAIEFISQQEALANTCTNEGGRLMAAFSTDGNRLWDALAAPNQVWPLLVMAPNGSRLARETLVISHPIDAFSPLTFDDVMGQLVEVYDAASGKLVLKAPASPVLDGGGNVAISPSGRRVAVLDAGAIQVYDLPAPTAQPQPAEGHPAR